MRESEEESSTPNKPRTDTDGLNQGGANGVEGSEGLGSTYLQRERLRSLHRSELTSYQSARLAAVLQTACRHPLYQLSFQRAGLSDSDVQQLASNSPPGSHASHSASTDAIEMLHRLPFLKKEDILPGRRGDASKLFCLPLHNYTRLHQTSGSRGWPMPVYDTAADWAWWLECWQYVLDSADVTPRDIVMMAFSFGPFIGFWTANDALIRRGCLVVPGGGLSSVARLQLMIDHGCTLICSTPTYALHLAAVAKEHSIDLAGSSVSRVIVAGEPGGSIPAVRDAIESAWNARVVDHAGASEIGAWGFACDDDSGMHVCECEFIAEFFHFDQQGNATAAAPGEPAEMVLTNLGRLGGPVLRYRTGDIVKAVTEHDHKCRFVKLEGGVLGRADDMIVVRGVNIFPSSIEAIVREVDPTAEFRITATREGQLDRLAVQAEISDSAAECLSELMQDRLAMRVRIECVPSGTLPRSEAKSKRFVDDR